MKVLVAGDWHSDLHESEVCRSLRRLGHEALEFKWFHYFRAGDGKTGAMANLLGRLQNKFVLGPLITRINHDFLEMVHRQRPDLVFVYRGTHLTAQTLRSIRNELPDCRLVGYNNDDPFSPAQPKYLWRLFKEGIPVYDLMLAYREANLHDFRRAGARRVELMRSWYVPDRNYPVEISEADQSSYECDVVFVGHYEPDQRLEYLEAIAKRGYRVRLFGPTKYWKAPLERSDCLAHLSPVRMVWGADYNKALCGAKLALCFLSKLNRDTYTRRCFEIPATRSLLLSEYSDDLSSLYQEGIEAEFFRSKEEMLEKIDRYLCDSDLRVDVAQAGFLKVRSAGHDVDSRIARMIELAKAGG